MNIMSKEIKGNIQEIGKIYNFRDTIMVRHIKGKKEGIEEEIHPVLANTLKSKGIIEIIGVMESNPDIKPEKKTKK